jgi:dipeptidyl aminopeptidase/acylaminoacyl peptidase
VVAAEGGPPRNLTNHPAAEVHPSWSHDGRWIYFASDRSGRFEIWKAPKDGGEAVQVTHRGGVRPRESVDGKYIYYQKGKLAGGGPLFRMPVTDGDEVQVMPPGGHFAVTAKGVYMGPAAPGDRAIRFLDAVTGKVRTLAVPAQPPLSLTASRDDAFIVWAQLDRMTQDLMLVEGFR